MIEKFSLRKAFLAMPVITLVVNGGLLLTASLCGLPVPLSLVLILLGGTALMIGVGLYLGGHYARRAELVVHALHSLGEGNLTAKLKLDGRDDFAWLAYEYDTARRGVATLVKGIGETAHGVTGSAGQLAAGANRIHTGSNQQSEAATQIVHGVEDTARSAALVAERAREAQTVAEQARKLAIGGRDMLGKVITEIEHTAGAVRASSESIAELGRKTQSINEMVRVIRDIADQTNLLALNAAIEAARAGEQGRGFAVVADEVRKLAEKSARAAQEITGQIESVVKGTHAAVASMEDCVAHVGNGVELARETGEAVGSLNEGAELTLRQVADIATAMADQRVAATAIAEQIERISAMARDNRDEAERNAEAAAHLNHLSGALDGAIASFRA